MKVKLDKKRELEDYTTHWLAIYNHMDIFDGAVGVGVATLMIESSIDDKLKESARDLVANILKRL